MGFLNIRFKWPNRQAKSALLVTKGFAPSGVLASATGAQTNFSKDRFVLVIFSFCLLSVLAQAAMILISWKKLPPEVPLFYSRPWGEAMLASALALWSLPIMVVVLVTVNFLIAVYFFSDNKFLSRILLMFSFLIALMTFYDTFKIILLLT